MLKLRRNRRHEAAPDIFHIIGRNGVAQDGHLLLNLCGSLLAHLHVLLNAITIAVKTDLCLRHHRIGHCEDDKR
jgi:hypothetical protein